MGSEHSRYPKAKNLLNGPTVSPTSVENMAVKAGTEVQTSFLPSACSRFPVCPAQHELYSNIREKDVETVSVTTQWDKAFYSPCSV